MFYLAFPINAFNFLTQNFTKTRKIPITKVQRICFSPQHSFKTIIWLQCFATISQKTNSTSSLKRLQKIKTCQVQMFRIFVFDLKIASKPFCRKLHMTKYWFKRFLTFCLVFPENGFNFFTQKVTKQIGKVSFSKVYKICFSSKGRFKIIF